MDKIVRTVCQSCGSECGVLVHIHAGNPPEKVAEITWIPAAQIRDTARSEGREPPGHSSCLQSRILRRLSMSMGATGRPVANSAMPALTPLKGMI
jgi:anaerobic selenocysteine-containing dehydrogenase